MKRQRPSLFVGFRRYQRFFPFWKQKTHHNPFFRVRTRSRQWWIFKLVLRNKNFKKKSKTPLSARGLETVRLSEETRGFSFSTQREEGGMRFNLLLSEELTWRSCCSTTRNCPYFRMRLSFFLFVFLVIISKRVCTVQMWCCWTWVIHSLRSLETRTHYCPSSKELRGASRFPLWNVIYIVALEHVHLHCGGFSLDGNRWLYTKDK